MEEGLRSSGGALVSYMRSIFGTYNPTGDGFGGADWEYIFSCIIFCLLFYCILRIIGSLFK